MKKRNRIFTAFLAATLIIAPSALAFAGAAPDGSTDVAKAYGEAFTNWKTNNWENGLSTDWTQVSMTPGSDETSMDFAWYSKTTEETSLVYGQNSDLSDGKNVEITSVDTNQTDKNGTSYTSNKAVLTDLQPGTTYYYQVAGKPVHSFQTGTSDKFTFAFVGDPQIGSSNELKGSDTEEFYNAQSNAVASDSYNWSQTLNKIQQAGSDFVVSAGDQIQTTAKKAPGKSTTTSEIEYAGYLSPEALTALPVATTVGNHDADNANYQYHFNVPNLSNLGDNGTVGGDYYFTYGDVLFMMLNTQDTNSAEHIEFIQNTISKNPDCKWKVVTLHQDIYGSAEHSNEPEIVNLRYALTPTFEKYGVDVVLTGHDHAYSRSKFLKADSEVKEVTYNKKDFKAMLGKDVDYSGEGTIYTAPQNIKDDTTDSSEQAYLEYLNSIMDKDNITDDSTSYAINPSGILYLTAGSSSGSKYYDLVPRQQSYIANRWQEDVPTYSLINVTETSMTINTYRTDNDSKIDDTLTIVKTADRSELDAKVTAIQDEIANGTITEKDYTSDSWNALLDALKKAEALNEKSTQAEINLALEKLSSARSGLQKKPSDSKKDSTDGKTSGADTTDGSETTDTTGASGSAKTSDTSGNSDATAASTKKLAAGTSVTSSSDAKITLKDTNGILPENVVFSSSKISDTSKIAQVRSLVTSKISGVTDVVLYELNLTDKTTELHQLDGTVQITMDLPFSLGNNETVKVYRVDNNNLVECTASVKDQKLVFETDHFSTFAFAKVTTAANGKTTSVQTGDNQDAAIWTIVCIAGMAVLGASVFSRRKNNKKRDY